MRLNKFGSQLDRKSKNCFFFLLFLMFFSRIKRNKILISQLSCPKFRYFTDQDGPRGGTHENEF